MTQLLYDILTGLSRRVYGVWDKDSGWLTNSGRVIAAKHPEELEFLLCDNRQVRRFVGFVSLQDTMTTNPKYETDPYWRTQRDG